MNVVKKRGSWPLQFLLALLLCSFVSLAHAADWYVGTTGTDAPGAGTSAATPFKTIGYAVNKASAGDVIHIGAGTFTEQVAVGKSLTLVGQGAAQTIIKAPAALTKSFSTAYPPTISDYYAVVYAHDADNINVSQLTVDGGANGNGFQEFIGVGYLNAGGTVDNCRVISITNNPPYNSNYGLGLYAYAGTGTARSLTVSNSYFKDFQKNAMLFYGANLTVNVDGNTIEGAGTIAQLAQNGIQMSFNAKGTIKNNNISKLAYSGTDYVVASGVLIQDAGSGIIVANNTFTNCMLSVYFINSAMGKITGNKITNSQAALTGAYYYWGIVVSNGDAEVAFNEIDNGGAGLGIDGNTSAANQNTTMNAHNNIVKNSEFGITIECDNDTTGSKVTGKANCNSITLTETLLYNNQSQTYFYAICNWLGTVNDSTIAAHIEGLVTFKPFLQDGVDLLPTVAGFQPAGTATCSCSNLNLTLKVKKDVFCYGKDDGTVTITVSGGTAPYMYSVDGGDFLPVTGTEFTVGDLTAGQHLVIVKDNVGNAQQINFTINQPATPLDATLVSDVDLKCNGSSTGSVTIKAVGGTVPYIVVGRPDLAPFRSSITITNLAAGAYDFIVQDSSGCQDHVADTLTEPTRIKVTAAATPACNGSNGSVTISATGGTPPYTGTGVKSNLSPGSYTFKVTDANGCTDSVKVTLSGTGAGTFNPLPETFPNAFNTSFYTSLVNKTFVGSSGTWTVNSDDHASIGVITPVYSPSSSYALTVANFKTTGCGDGWAKAVSPKLNLTGPCCPNAVKLNFTLWTYVVVCNDTKAGLSIDFLNEDGTTWTNVWSKTSAQLFTAYGANGKGMISIAVPVAYQNANFRYRIRGEMSSGDCNNFYVFIDDVNVDAPASCTPVGSIGDFVWYDKDGDGKQDVGEPGIGGATVKLTYPDGTTATKTTGANGYYLFSNLPAGNYTVTFATPSGYVPTLSNVGTDETVDSDPVNGVVSLTLAAGQNNLTIDAGYKVPVCTNTVNAKETFPNKFNPYFTTSLYNSTFVGSSGTWTVNSNSKATMVAIAPYYSPSSSYALKVVNYNTAGCGSGWSKAVSPKVDLSSPCCPAELKMTFTLWTYKVVCNDSKARLEIDFLNEDGTTWTKVWSKTSAQLFTAYGANGKTSISIAVPVAYQNANFRYRIRGEMDASDGNNFYVFLDDILIGSPATCGSSNNGSCNATVQGSMITTPQTNIAANAATAKPVAATEEAVDFKVSVFPNPTASQFNLRLASKSSATVTVRVVDVMGRVVKTISTGANQSVRFGTELKSGTYVAEVVQDGHKESVKLIKL